MAYRRNLDQSSSVVSVIRNNTRLSMYVPLPDPCSANHFLLPSSGLSETKSQMYRKAGSQKEASDWNLLWTWIEVETTYTTLPNTPVLFHLGLWRHTEIECGWEGKGRWCHLAPVWVCQYHPGGCHLSLCFYFSSGTKVSFAILT